MTMNQGRTEGGCIFNVGERVVDKEDVILDLPSSIDAMSCCEDNRYRRVERTVWDSWQALLFVHLSSMRRPSAKELVAARIRKALTSFMADEIRCVCCLLCSCRRVDMMAMLELIGNCELCSIA